MSGIWTYQQLCSINSGDMISRPLLPFHSALMGILRRSDGINVHGVSGYNMGPHYNRGSKSNGCQGMLLGAAVIGRRGEEPFTATIGTKGEFHNLRLLVFVCGESVVGVPSPFAMIT
jgi:hypothetical protein